MTARLAVVSQTIADATSYTVNVVEDGTIWSMDCGCLHKTPAYARAKAGKVAKAWAEALEADERINVWDPNDAEAVDVLAELGEEVRAAVVEFRWHTARGYRHRRMSDCTNQVEVVEDLGSYTAHLTRSMRR